MRAEQVTSYHWALKDSQNLFLPVSCFCSFVFTKQKKFNDHKEKQNKKNKQTNKQTNKKKQQQKKKT